MNSRGEAVFINCRGGQAKLIQQIANPQKFLGSFRYRQSAKFFWGSFRYSKSVYKILPPLSQNSPKSCLFKTNILYNFEYLLGEKVCICRLANVLSPPKSLGLQITKEIGSANPESCKTYLSFAHLCLIDDFRNKKKFRILHCMMNKTPFEEVQGTL
jgi:hypothetical protein